MASKKVQIGVIGGMRKKITLSSDTPGTTISEIGDGTVTLAQLRQLLGIVTIPNTQIPSGGGGGSQATIVVGPGLSGGGPVIGNVPINLTIPIGAHMLLGDGGGGDGDPGPPGPAGAAGVAGSIGPVGPPGKDGEPGEDATPIPGPIGPTGAAGAAGPAGAIGAPGQDGTPGEDAMMIPGPIGPTGAAGSVGQTGLSGAVPWIFAEEPEERIWTPWYDQRQERSRGTVVGTLTGCTTAPTTTILWAREGDIISITIPGVSAVSNANTMTISGTFPAEIVSASAPFSAVYPVEDNSAFVGLSACRVTATAIAFLLNGTGTGFNVTGTKGLSSTVSFTYSRL